MQVETYECSETAAEPIEACEEAIRLINELGLEGQNELVQPKTDERPADRVPYREITEAENFVYQVLCPNEVTLGRYCASPIPLRVLQIAAHAKQTGMFEEMYVWDRASVVVKDPVLVGKKKNPSRTWERKTYILARWGEVLESFPTLLKQAIEQKRSQLVETLEACQRKITAASAEIAGMDNDAVISAGPTAKYELLRT